ncbi:MAG TPA: hypothetical protein VK524_32125, partial [Polyangiaceae bacterium]|nr:hypothetical protein [Polyangiaceae bacterium]
LEAAMLMAMPPSGSRHVSIDFSWGWGLYASALASALGVYFALHFGGPLESGATAEKPPPSRPRTSRGETLH